MAIPAVMVSTAIGAVNIVSRSGGNDFHGSGFYFYRDQMREWIFYTDKRAFADRYGLATQNGLAGICSWVLGEEDPAIWSTLPVRK